MSTTGARGNVAPHPRREARGVLVTGGSGYLGRQLVADLAAAPEGIERLVAVDVAPVAPADRLEGVGYEELDVRAPELAEVVARHEVDTVVHLAAIVTPPPGMTRETERAIDVGGTANVVRACVAAGVDKLVVTSSGAAYGYHADNPVPLTEDDALRGNPEFAYSDHKRQVEELLALARALHPELHQVVFRPGAILGDTVDNQITALFEQRFVLGVAGSDAPFCFVWDRDVVACLRKAVFEDVDGVFNLVGDGRTTMPAIARRLGRRYVPVPAGVLGAALGVLHAARLSRYGPEQVGFLRYRPVLANDRLKGEFGYVPERTSDEVFEGWLAAHPQR
ncbi:MAG: SDR family oxidoreductase [Acidimicrobiales bacterium]